MNLNEFRRHFVTIESVRARNESDLRTRNGMMGDRMAAMCMTMAHEYGYLWGLYLSQY